MREFPKLSSRAIAGLCGVSADFVSRIRPEQVSSHDTSSKLLGRDGKAYPARRPASAPAPAPGSAPAVTTHERGPAWDGVIRPPTGAIFAKNAIAQLEQIHADYADRAEALRLIRRWLP